MQRRARSRTPRSVEERVCSASRPVTALGLPDFIRSPIARVCSAPDEDPRKSSSGNLNRDCKESIRWVLARPEASPSFLPIASFFREALRSDELLNLNQVG